ncbi:PREDICTED: fatty-acid amide hydrolase 2-A-like [Nicrophorus vespilloides]|uniref:Fatty-acid amide hydrolase 2-A-like n=1 Tax=Nicrophorus vespilloides TaxID=110193 RepID=A0ABM1N8Y3_NICVS|nr:PREDICTED: fatty-acid amide hydrolase 2-A-like [Nicrophorus vespilloides]
MNLLVRISGFFIILGETLLAPFLWLLDSLPRQRVPPIKDELLLLSATQLAKKIRNQQVSCEEVIKSYINRIREVNPIINAVSEERYESAMHEAREADRFIKNHYLSKEKLKNLKPFFGVPITLKECCGVEGLTWSVGSRLREGIRAYEDSEALKRLKGAGFIPLLVSSVPEYCVGLESINLVNGWTKNPYNTNRTSGGSSGGEGALLGSGASVVGLGTDFAGSIRIPCQFNGIYGHKTTSRIVPKKGFYPDTTDDRTYDYFTIGPMTRYVEDLMPMLKILSGAEGTCLNLSEKVDLSKLKVFFSKGKYDQFGVPKVQKEIVAGINEARQYLESHLSMETEEIEIEDFKHGFEICIMMYLTLGGLPNFLENPNNPKKDLNVYMEVLKNLMGKSRLSLFVLMFIILYRYTGFIPKSHFPYYQKKMERMKSQFNEALGDNGVFIYPSFPSSAFGHYRTATRAYGICFSMIFNVMGCPSTQIPIGFDKSGMPIGLQIVAAPKQDRLCLAVAEELSKRFGGWVPPT